MPNGHKTQYEMQGPPTVILPRNTRYPNANDVAVGGGAGGVNGGEGGVAAAALRGYVMVDPSPSPMPGAGGESPAMMLLNM